MPIFYPDILEQAGEPTSFSYDEKDVMLYALSLGIGSDPMDERELSFVYEHNLLLVPSVVTVLGSLTRGSPLVDPPMGSSLRKSELNMVKVLAGGRKTEIHRPLPTAGAFTSRSRIAGVFDKGKDKGAVVYVATDWIDEAGETVVTATSSIFARGDGGFGGPSEGAPEPHITPDRAPDLSLDVATQPGQALLYRLNGDRNPIHADPNFARRAGFDRPILHGLCTYGITCWAIVKAITNYDPAPIFSHEARFSSPVYPGDTVTVDMWLDGKEIAFEARVKARDVTVVKNGLTVLR